MWQLYVSESKVGDNGSDQYYFVCDKHHELIQCDAILSGHSISFEYKLVAFHKVLVKQIVLGLEWMRSTRRQDPLDSAGSHDLLCGLSNHRM